MFVESLNIIVANLPTFLIYYNVTYGFYIITNYGIKVVRFGGNHEEFYTSRVRNFRSSGNVVLRMLT